MKKMLFIMIAAAMVFAGCKKDDDESADSLYYFASDRTWTFGDQTWSDIVHCPECNKETFEKSYTDPQCRSYTVDGKIQYYYNWPYVDTNRDVLCPSPWRVPTSEDFERLESSILHSETLVDEWGYTGFVNARANNDQSVEMDDMNRGWVISKTRETGNNGYNKALRYPSTGWGLVSYGAHASGYVVRCVK